MSDSWSLTASHEMLEMLADPFGNRVVAGRSPKRGQGRVEFLVEVCDPSEAAEFGYTVNDILVSDFYTSRYFDPAFDTHARYSFTGAITKPREVLRGGYVSWHDPVSNHWWQQNVDRGSARTFRDVGKFDVAQAPDLRSLDRRPEQITPGSIADPAQERRDPQGGGRPGQGDPEGVGGEGGDVARADCAARSSRARSRSRVTDGDDAEARRRRAQELRRQIDEQAWGAASWAPPRSPYEFIERETRKRAEAERPEGERGPRDEAEEGQDDVPAVDPGPGPRDGR